jgi:acetyl esterase/lipase
MKFLLQLLVLAGASSLSFAQPSEQRLIRANPNSPFVVTSEPVARETISLWPGQAPGALGTQPQDIPTLTPYLVEGSNRPAIVVCPGGGYGGLAPHEGHDYALWLNQQGISAFVLKYRLGPAGYRHPIMLGDAQRAIRLVRHRAAEWRVDTAKVGIMGSSAGGHLASTALTHFDAGKADASDPVDHQSSRPDFGILCYAVITMGDHTHQGSRKNLLGDNPDPALIELLSNEKHVTMDTPPCFLWHTWEDKGVKIENSLQFAAALAKADVPFDFHVYEKGRHGIGLNDKPPFANAHPWSRDLVFWLKTRGVLPNH